jgi:cell division inhibitor SulA/protein ImuA
MEANAAGAGSSLVGTSVVNDLVDPVVERPALERLLDHPAIWRGRSSARVAAVPTGFGALDECLPGNGWPRSGLVEILIPRVGIGEISLLLPVLATLTRQASARWCAWVSPPLQPFAPALAAHGIALERLFVARVNPALKSSALWAFEQSLVSGACEVVLGWAMAGRTLANRTGANRTQEAHARHIRRLQLAAEKGRTLGVLFRPRRAAAESSGAVLRIVVEPAEQGARVTLLKSRGGRRGSIDITWNSPAHGSP